MLRARISNSSGETLELTGNEPVYQLVNIEGLNPPPAVLNQTDIYGMDGALFNSSKLATRNIVLTVYINGDVEVNRLRLYSYFRTKEKCTFYVTTDTLDVEIDGYVDTVECNMFQQNVFAQISLICMNPYFHGVAQTETGMIGAEALFTFPFSINIDDPIPISNHTEADALVVLNAGESDTGCEIIVSALAGFSTLEIADLTTGDTFKLVGTFLAGDTIIINTVKGAKSVELVRAGVVSNALSTLQQDSVFFQLAPGANAFGIIIDGVENDGAVDMTIRYYLNYRGL